MTRSISQFTGAEEDGFKHGDGEFAGGGVLVGRVVGGEQGDAVGHAVFGEMGEKVCGFAKDDRLAAQGFEVGVEGNFAEGDDDFEVGEGGEFAVGELGAVGDL